MSDNKHPTKQELDVISIQNTDSKEQGSALVVFLKKTPKFFNPTMCTADFAWGEFFILVI